MIIPVCDRVENNVGKGENTGYWFGFFSWVQRKNPKTTTGAILQI